MYSHGLQDPAVSGAHSHCARLGLGTLRSLVRTVRLQPHSPALARGCRCQVLAKISPGAWWASIPSDPSPGCWVCQCREGMLGWSRQLGGMAQCEAAVVPECPGVPGGALPQRHLPGLGGSRWDASCKAKVTASQLPACRCLPTCLRVLPGLWPCADAGETRCASMLAVTQLAARCLSPDVAAGWELSG